MALTNEDYNINLDIKYQHGEVIDLLDIIAGCKEKWFNQTLTQVNNSVVRIGIIEGEFHWHKHVDDDEFFFVLEGKLLIDLEGRTIEINPGQAITISKNTMHRTRAPKKTVIIMVENRDINPVGNID